MNEISMIGLDLAKNVFQLHGVDASGNGGFEEAASAQRGGEVLCDSCRPALVGMEACGSAHHWARVINRYGHEVKLMPPAYVKPYVKRNKNDGRDAEAICEAVSRPTMRFVAVKSVEQQAMLSVHTTRALLVKQRTMMANALRAQLSELGIVAAQGHKGLHELMARLEAPSQEIPEIMRSALLVLARAMAIARRQRAGAGEADREGGSLRSRGSPVDGGAQRRSDHRQYGAGKGAPMPACSAPAVTSRPGSGLTGRDHGTGGKHRPGRISKQGDRVLRTLLINGASAHLRQQMRRGVSDPWLRELLARRPYKVAMVAFAAKTARIIWAMLAKGEDYRDRASASAAA